MIVASLDIVTDIEAELEDDKKMSICGDKAA